jgi:hypothetical protein
VEVAVLPEVKLTGVVAEIVKSGDAFTVNVTIAVRDTVLVPVIVTVTVPGAVNVQDNVEVPAPVTLLLERLQAELSTERETVSLNWFSAVIVIVEVPAA